MATRLTETQIQNTIQYIVLNMVEAGVNPNQLEQVLRYVVLNPIPDQATVDAETTTREATEKASRITRLEAELDKLKN